MVLIKEKRVKAKGQRQKEFTLKGMSPARLLAINGSTK
jgi:hypothetical protein